MSQLPIYTEPGFTFEDAANATVDELLMFDLQELAQLLSDAAQASAKASCDIAEWHENSFRAETEWQEQFCREQSANATTVLRVADKAFQNLLAATVKASK